MPIDQPPARGKICIAFGQRPDRVQMVRQHDHRIDCERMMPARLTKRSVLRQQPQPPLRQIDAEEEAAPGNEVATIVGHAGTTSMVLPRRDGYRCAPPILRASMVLPLRAWSCAFTSQCAIQIFQH